LWGSSLYITSTASHEFVTVSQTHGQLSVANTTIKVGNSSVRSVSTGQVSEVVVYAYGGGDVINLRPSAATIVTEKSYIKVFKGNNQVFGGAGSNYIVAGDAAGNNVLHGWTGNDDLAAGSSTDKLNGGGGFDWFYRPINPASPFVNGEHVSDVKQGYSPSCQTDAALAEAVQQGFNFANSIHYLGGSKYQVSLYGGSVKETVNFNGWYDSDDPIPTNSGEFWTILMYRARLERLGIDPTANYSVAQWDSINTSTGGALYSVADAIYGFTGKTGQFTPMNTVSPQQLQSYLARRHYLVASSAPGSGVSTDGIVNDHAYAVLAIYYQGGMWKVQLYNPWGFDSTNGRTIEALAGGTPTNLGFITVSWAQFVNRANFQGITIA
jgi:hypothetical protein